MTVAAIAAGVSGSTAGWLAARVAISVRGRSRAVADSHRHTPPRDFALRAVRRAAGSIVPNAIVAFGARNARELITAAGLGGRLEARDVVAARVAAAAVAATLIPRLVSLVPPRLAALAAGFWLLAAAELPAIWLRARARHRDAALRRALPDALDMLRAALAAGLPLRGALRMTGEYGPQPAAGELSTVVAEVALGASLANALDAFAARNRLPEITAVVRALKRAAAHGSPLAPVVAAQAADARRARNRELVERGARAGPKIQLAVAATLVPAAMIFGAAVLVTAVANGNLRPF